MFGNVYHEFAFFMEAAAEKRGMLGIVIFAFSSIDTSGRKSYCLIR